jgi:hypothetical protein
MKGSLSKKKDNITSFKSVFQMQEHCKLQTRLNKHLVTAEPGSSVFIYPPGIPRPQGSFRKHQTLHEVRFPIHIRR